MIGRLNKVAFILVFITIVSYLLVLSTHTSFAFSNPTKQDQCFDGCNSKCFVGTSRYYSCKSDCNRRCYRDFG